MSADMQRRLAFAFQFQVSLIHASRKHHFADMKRWEVQHNKGKES